MITPLPGISLYNLPDKFRFPQLVYASPIREYPLAYDQTHFTATERWLTKKNYYAPAPLNTPNGRYSSAFLVSETPDREEGDGIWSKRVYATIPASIPDWSSISVTFPALNLIRAAFTQSVTCRIVRDYFLVGTGQTYPDAGSIPYTRAMQVTFPTYPGNEQFPILGGGSFALNNGGGVLQPSTPTLTAWQALVAADAATANSFSVQCADSSLKRYMGNIWCRSTPFVKAQ